MVRTVLWRRPVFRAVYYCNVSAATDFARIGRVRLWLATLVFATLAPPAGTVSLGDLYSVTVPFAGQSEGAQLAAFREALRDILVRVTGRRDAAELETLAPLVAQAGRHVVSFRRATGNQLAVSFDGPAIENAIDLAGLPFWGPERPLTLVCLAIDRGGGRRSLTAGGSPGDDRLRIERVAARRGIPLVWPGSGDNLERGFLQAWSGDHAPLIAAARRYGADGVLIGRASLAASGDPMVAWTFSAPGISAQATGDLESGPELAADRYAGVHASHSAGLRSEQVVTVTGIDTLEAYAAATRALASLPPVRAVAVDEVTPDAVSFVLTIRGDPSALRQAIERDGRLPAVDASRLIYSLAP